MKKYSVSLLLIFLLIGATLFAQTKTERLFMDVHYFAPGTVSYADVSSAHAKDLAVQKKHGVNFLTYWVDEKSSAVYCLSSATDSAHIVAVHREAHGLLPQQVYAVTDGKAAMPQPGGKYFLDTHQLGAGNVTAGAVAAAHEKDLAVQKKYGVNFINYWVNEEKGVVLCLSQAVNASKVTETHKEAHGLLPVTVTEVKQGQ